MDIIKQLHSKFSLVTVSENKVPNFSWKKWQTEKQPYEAFLKQFEYKGGLFKKDGLEIPKTTNFGIVTGFEDLECLDVDLKVFSTTIEKNNFWNELLQFFKDHISDFDEKFTIYKTKNDGYHILYKSKNVSNNLKLAVLEGHTQAVLETRGIGGYVFAYPENKVSKNSYFDIDYISDEDRETLIGISKFYNFVPLVEDKEIIKKSGVIYDSNKLTPWDDFNNKNTIWDIVKNEFSIPPNGHKDTMTVIKRHGSESAHSGYIFRNTGTMYLHSTGTIYPHEKQITPYDAIRFRDFGGDFSACAKAMYQQGYGARFVKKEDLVIEQEEIQTVKNEDFPIEIFPQKIQNYFISLNKTLDNNLDFLGCSMLWLGSLCVGNSAKITIKNGWEQKAVIWMCLVAKAGIGKTPSIINVIKPLLIKSGKMHKKYVEDKKEYDEWSKLTKKEKESTLEVQKPKKEQFIVDDATLESLIDLHDQNQNGIGIFRDELNGWIKDMNKYREGSDLQTWLSSWSSSPISVTRLSRDGSYIESPFMPILGGIQPDILENVYTEDNKSSGFMDRILLCYPETKVSNFNLKEIEYSEILWYSEVIVAFLEYCRGFSDINENNEITSLNLRFSNEALAHYEIIHNEITTIQNSDEENEYFKSMYPKMKNYIPRFALILEFLDCFFEGKKTIENVSLNSTLKAEKLFRYFTSMAKKMKINSWTKTERRNVISKLSKTASKKEQANALLKSNPNIKHSEIAELLQVTKGMVSKYLK
jgi:hypothetical protein